MNEKDAKGHDGDKTEHQSYRIRLPGFITEEGIGLGDAIKRVTYPLGVRPCGGCERRAAALNRWFVFTGCAK
jgi:hypothetical protein